VKKPKLQSWESLGQKLDFNYWQVNKVFWQTIQRLRGKGFNIVRSSKD